MALVDEVHLCVYPVAVGNGPRLFPDGAPQRSMNLVGCDALGNGVVHLAYSPVA